MNLVDVSGADGDQDIPRLECIVQSCRDLVKGVQEACRLPAFHEQFSQLSRHLRRFGGHPFARGEGRCDENFVGCSEGSGEVVHEGCGPRDLMRLEDAPDSTSTELFADCLERRADGGGMVAVVVQQGNAAPRAD